MVRREGARDVAREIEHYNLDAILAVMRDDGYLLYLFPSCLRQAGRGGGCRGGGHPPGFDGRCRRDQRC
jgi:hypothetical protein